ncbi:MAG TPA: TonB-dependent receptor [Longimicrobiales bacterium]|nr:TonB-dependent receptor [Longimicrobiales bacterium]
MKTGRPTRPRPAPAAALLFAPLLLLGAPVASAAQETAGPDEARQDTFALPQIVVTATRVPLHRDALPTPVTVLTGRELRERGIRTVAQALRDVPGAAVVRSGSHGAQTSLFLRGGESDYVKVLVDGVPVNEPGGAIDFADLSTDQVERIEVVRGPVSVLYGTDAVAGVVQIFTRRGRGAPSLAVTATGARGERPAADDGYGALDAEATLSGSAGPIAYTVGGGRFWTDGSYPFNNERSLSVGTARVAWIPGPATELAVTTRYAASESHFPTDGAGNLVDENAFLDRRMWTAALEAGRRLTDRIDARVQAGLASRVQDAVDRPDGAADTSGVYASELATAVDRRTLDARLSAELPHAILTAGVALDWSEGATSYASESEWGPAAAEAEYGRANRGYYAQLLANPMRPLNITVGGRIDDNDTFGGFETFRVGAAYELPWRTRLRAAIGRGFREPTFGESFGSGFGDRGNAALLPERSLSREVGVEHGVGASVRLGATWFHQRFEDLIQFTFTTTGPDAPNYFNVGAARAEGVELTAEAGLHRLTVSAGYTWLDTRVLDPGLATDASFVQGRPLLRRPAHSGSLAARYRLDRGVLGLTMSLVGEREDVDFGAAFPFPRVTLPPYATVDLAAEHALPWVEGQAVKGVLRVENLTGAEYEGVRGFPAPGRLLHVGVRVVTGDR